MSAASRVLLLVAQALALPKEYYPAETKVWFGELPGDAGPNAPAVAFPNQSVPEGLHGAATYTAWQATNGFARFWHVDYGLLVYRGEPKHGVWRWKVDGYDLPFWWCDLGGRWDGPDGLADEVGVQHGMQPLWDQIQKSPKNDVNKLGPLGQKAGLSTLALDIVQVDIATKSRANVWKHVGVDGQDLRFRKIWHYGIEFYLFKAWYAWPEMLSDFTPCDNGYTYGDGSGGCNAIEHTFIAFVLPDVYSEPVGLPSWGLHYDSSAGNCPVACGAGPCLCDGYLVDLAFEANLQEDRPLDDGVFFFPSGNPGDGAAPESEPTGESGRR